jgi:hypothetical protein
MGDCPRCKKEGGSNNMPKLDPEDLPQGGRRKWIQKVTGHMKEGAFTKQALKKHMTPEEFADEVKKHPKHYALKTRRRAQFLRNIRRKTLRRK